MQAYTKTRGYQEVAVVTNRQVGGDRSRDPDARFAPGGEELTIALDYAAPGRFAIRGSTRAGRWVRVIDRGKPQKIRFQGASASYEAMNPPALIDYRLLEKGLSGWRVVRQEEVAVGDAHVRCTVIEAVYLPDDVTDVVLRRAPGITWGDDTRDFNEVLFRLSKRVLWVDDARHAVLREVDSIEGDWWTPDAPKEQRALIERTVAVQELEWNEPPPESHFVADLSALPPSVPDDTSPRRFADRLAQNPELRYLWLPIVDGCDDAGDLYSRVRCVERATSGTCAKIAASAEVERAQLEGCVTLKWTVNSEGRVEDMRVAGGAGLGLDEELAACMAQWRYRPPQSVGSNPHQEMSLVGVGVHRMSISTLWRLRRAEFEPEDGASRPVFLKTSYPYRGSKLAVGSAAFRVHLIVGVDGRPRDVRVDPPVDPKLDAVAVRTVSSWRFRPGQLDGQPVGVPAVFYLTVGADNGCFQPGLR